MAKEKLKICALCNMEIKLSKDNYVHLIDYLKGKFNREGYYHTQCYNDKLKEGVDIKKMKQQAFGLLKKAREMIGREEIVEI